MTIASSPSSVPLSIIITAHNEGAEVRRTLDSISANTTGRYEVLLVDDASSDGSCDKLAADDLRVFTHAERIGVAYSRNEAAKIARGDTLAFLDAHQRLTPECLNRCAETALKHQAIVCPDVQDLSDRSWTGHGAFIRLCEKNGYFNAAWSHRAPHDSLSRITSMIVPGYVMTREVYEKVFWIRALRGWGASEPAIAIKAFFQDIDILHLCGHTAFHLFRGPEEVPYAIDRDSVWRNHALVARICFDDKTWYEHWLPNVFYRHLTPAARYELESPAIVAEHDAFLANKRRPDREFWRGLMRIEEPTCLRP